MFLLYIVYLLCVFIYVCVWGGGAWAFYLAMKVSYYLIVLYILKLANKYTYTCAVMYT